MGKGVVENKKNRFNEEKKAFAKQLPGCFNVAHFR